MPDYLAVNRDFNMLSLVHLLEARDLYHVHLMNKANVVATAIGLYRIRRSDPWPPNVDEKPKKGKRTLRNSEVRPYSWPCILVFVDRWIDQDDVGYGEGEMKPEDMVPKALHMPDGKVVPVCVIEATKDEKREDLDISHLTFPDNLIGGGYPLVCNVQQQERFASIGCLVTDGHLTYALTNRHVSGEPGETVYAILKGEKIPIGTTSKKQITRLPFQKVYSEWPGKNVYVNVDVGLIEIDNENIWTAQVYGIGQMGKLADLSVDNISLRLIGCPVRAYGCASGQMFGEIQALFYRYKTLSGFEYISDFLIGPREGVPFSTHPGDSGTVWLLETDDKRGLMPIAVQWGGHAFLSQGSKQQFSYALATRLSTVCNELEVDIVRDWNLGFPEYWGKVGHYTIGNKACDAVSNPNLKTLMQANRGRITFEKGKINKKDLAGISKNRFIPLADVPDLVWKLGHFSRGNPEHPCHFADMDKPDPKSNGITLLQICTDAAKITVPVWQKYYDDVEDKSRGLLPFRVWQIYQEMVSSVQNGDVTRFLCAAGVLSHYVGDACQPLHISYMFNGDPADTIPVSKIVNGVEKTEMRPRAEGVHSAYEDEMLNYHVAEMFLGIETALSQATTLPPVTEARGAAIATVNLMQKTFDTIKPAEIITVYNQLLGQKPKAIAEGLWQAFKDKTIEVMVSGCLTLAMLWESAWIQGGGDITIQTLAAVEEDGLIALYTDRDFLKSLTLDHIAAALS